MSKRDRLLRNLENDTYVRLRPSLLQGVGVFAVKDIPKGVNPFKMANGYRHNTIEFTKSELRYVDPAVKKMIDDFI